VAVAVDRKAEPLDLVVLVEVVLGQ